MKRIQKVLFRNLLLIVGIVGFIIVIYGGQEQLKETWELLKNVSLASAMLLPLTQLVSYYFLSNYYRSSLATFGKIIGSWRAFGTTTALNFVNQILPSGGASGITYIIYAFKDAALPGQITLIQLGRYVLSFISYVPLLILAWIGLVSSGEMNKQLALVLGGLLLIALPGMFLVIAAIKNRSLVDSLAGGVSGLVNRIVGMFRRSQKPVIADKKLKFFMNEFHQGVTFLRQQGTRVIKPFLFILLSTIAEVTIVNLAFIIIGADVSPAVLVTAFAAANVVGVISVIPGDVGVHELTVITILSFVGVPESTAIAGTLLYRVFNKVVIMSIGFGFYVKYLKPVIKNATPSS